jgi:hypothetical protein
MLGDSWSHFSLVPDRYIGFRIVDQASERKSLIVAGHHAIRALAASGVHVKSTTGDSAVK